MDQVPAADSTVLRICVSCNHDPDGIEAVQALVAAAPAMPPRIEVCAFTPPTPKELARELASLEIFGKEVPLQQVRFMADPSTAAPGTFVVACFVPNVAVTEMDPQDVPGALVADIMLSMGIGELRVMTRVSSMGVAVTDQPPPDSLDAWDLSSRSLTARRHTDSLKPGLLHAAAAPAVGRRYGGPEPAVQQIQAMSLPDDTSAPVSPPPARRAHMRPARAPLPAIDAARCPFNTITMRPAVQVHPHGV